MNLANLNSFLKLGYFLDYSSPYRQCIDFSNINRPAYSDIPENELVKIGSNLFKQAVVKQFVPRSVNVVPLSGGLDSRALLACLLECTEAKNIHTYTFGTPGALDFTIGNRIAKKVGTKHEQFPLTKIQYNFDELMLLSERVDHQTILFHSPPVAMFDLLYKDAFVWSGAIIDVFFGIHTHVSKGASVENAKRNSINENLYSKSVDLSNVSEEHLYDLIDYDCHGGNLLVKEHVIDLLNRQIKYIAPHVLFKCKNKYNVLFTDKELVNFALSLDNKYIDYQYLYKKILLNSFPTIFSYPTKTNLGLPLDVNPLRLRLRRLTNKAQFRVRKMFPFLKNPYINYVDFNHEIRAQQQLRKIVHVNLMDLKERRILDWINIDKLWDEHTTKGASHAEAIITLASLEIHLKAGKQI